MDFTEVYKQTANLVAFSPGTHFLLTAVHDRIVVRRTDSLQVTRTWQISAATTPDPARADDQSNATQSTTAASDSLRITHAGWSCDSEYVLAACARKGVVNIFKLRDESWSARVDAGTEGLVKAEWAPDGRSIICFSEFGLRVTIWSLITGTATYVQFPIHADRGYAFRLDGRYFVLAERHKSKDTIGVYDTTDSYRLVRHFPVPTTALASLSISPTGNHLAICEGPLEDKVHFFSLAGDPLGVFAPDSDRGSGLKCIAWHPSGAYLAVAASDDKIFILETLTWAPVAVLPLLSKIPQGVAIWREPSNLSPSTQGFLSYERIQGPHSISMSRPEVSKPYPKSGTSQLSFNKSGTLLLARFHATANALHLFSFPGIGGHSSDRSDVALPKLKSVLIHRQSVTHAQWNPARKGSLAACCATGTIHFWSDEWVNEGDLDAAGEEVAECVGIPARSFTARELRWSPDGKGLLLLDKDTFCCAFEIDEDT